MGISAYLIWELIKKKKKIKKKKGRDDFLPGLSI